MKKLLLCVSVYLITGFSFKSVKADETVSAANMNAAAVENYIYNVYRQIDFKQGSVLSFEAFDKAYHGYLNLRDAGKLNGDKQILTICDFTLSSAENRMWVIDLQQKKVVFNTLVAHGQGSGEEYATAFSNDNNSHQSSLGFYVTGDTYDGEHGLSLRLNGMDNGYNDAAYDRGIVVHGADYVCSRFIQANQHLGRSWGCPAVSATLSSSIINVIKDGTCLFIYYPQKRYLKTAYWLNKPIVHLPDNNADSQLIQLLPIVDASFKPGKKEITKIEYVSVNGAIDSVKAVHLIQ